MSVFQRRSITYQYSLVL